MSLTPFPTATPLSFFPLHRPELEPDLRAGEHKLAALMTGSPRAFPPMKTIIACDQEHGFVYRLRAGWCARARHLRDGRSQILSVLLPGDLFGMRTMYTARQADEVFALGPVAAEAIDQRKLREAAAADGQLALRISWQMIEEDRRMPNWLVGIGRGNAEERLALMLLDLRGRLILSGGLPQGALEFLMPMTQTQMGELLGLTAVHVNRTVKRFRESGLATIGRGRAQIDSLAALHRLARPMLDVFEKDRPEFGAAVA